MRAKEFKKFCELLEQHGLSIDKGSGHYIVVKDGKRITSVSHSPRTTNSWRQSVRDLVGMGLLPKEAKRVKF